MSIEIRNNTGEPIVVSRATWDDGHSEKRIDEVEVNHDETYLLQEYHPDRCRFVIRPARNPHVPRDFRAGVRPDETREG